MEVRVQNAEGIPEDSFLRISSSDINRQAKFPVDQPFHFAKPLIEVKTTLQAAVLEPVATATVPFTARGIYRVPLAPTNGHKLRGRVTLEISECIPGSRPGFTANSLALHATSGKLDDAGDAKKNLDVHGILAFIQSMLQVVIRERPACPLEYMKAYALEKGPRPAGLGVSPSGGRAISVRVLKAEGAPPGSLLSFHVGPESKQVLATAGQCIQLHRPLQSMAPSNTFMLPTTQPNASAVRVRLLALAASTAIEHEFSRGGTLKGLYHLPFSSTGCRRTAMSIDLHITQTEQNGWGGLQRGGKVRPPALQDFEAGSEVARPMSSSSPTSPSNRLGAALAAREYLDVHKSLMRTVQELLQLIVREAPTDPSAFVAAYLDHALLHPDKPFKKMSTQMQAKEITSTGDVLHVPLHERPSVATWQMEPPPPLFIPKPLEFKPSVATWLGLPRLDHLPVNPKGPIRAPVCAKSEPEIDFVIRGEWRDRASVSSWVMDAPTSLYEPVAQEPLPEPSAPCTREWCMKASVGTWIQRQVEDSAPQEPSVGLWSSRPSVGTWLLQLPEADNTETSLEDWSQSASVGTWLQALPVVDVGAEFCSPWSERPSVGTWLGHLPPAAEMPKVEITEDPVGEDVVMCDAWCDRASVATWSLEAPLKIEGPWIPEVEYNEKPSVVSLQMELPVEIQGPWIPEATVMEKPSCACLGIEPMRELNLDSFSIGGEPFVGPFNQRPSVGTWLPPLRPSDEEPTEPSGVWNMRPSVGTWLQQPSPLEDSAPSETLSWNLRPSVATWSQQLPLPEIIEELSTEWSSKPSVGTWMQSLPTAQDNEPVAHMSFPSMPSVGTWLQPRCALSEHEPSFVPFTTRPSVGTWLARPAEPLVDQIPEPMSCAWELKPSVAAWAQRRRAPVRPLYPRTPLATCPSGPVIAPPTIPRPAERRRSKRKESAPKELVIPFTSVKASTEHVEIIDKHLEAWTQNRMLREELELMKKVRGQLS